jgi:putative ABC transport system permease protein
MIRIALRNLARHRFRTGITLGAIVFGVSGIILSGGFVHDTLDQLAEASIHSQTGHLQVARSGYFAFGSAAPEKYRIDHPDFVNNVVHSLPEVADVMSRIRFSGLLNNGRTDWPINGEGIEPSKEAALGTYLKLTAGRALDDRDKFGIMLGQGVANALRLGPGDHATVLVNTTEGALNTMEFDVVGVFETFSRDFDARAIRIPLAAARELLNTTGATVIVASLHRTADTELAVSALKARLGPQSYDVRSWIELNDFYEKTVKLYTQQFGVLQVITLLMVLLSVANSVNMSAFERVGEFGTMRALGNRAAHVFWLIVVEGALLGLIAAGIGAAFGISLALVISAIGIPMPPPPNANTGYFASVRIVPFVVSMAVIVGFASATVAALLPAFRVSRMPVADALRANV